MVFIVDKDGTFEEPLEKIWRFMAAPESAHTHPGNMNLQAEIQGEHTIHSYENAIPGAVGKVKHKVKMTMLPPVGFMMEYLEGPMAGSKTMQYYLPKGIKTDVVVVGEYISNVIPEQQLRTLVLRNLEEMFREDQENLRRFE
jgi:hypothetical protein